MKLTKYTVILLLLAGFMVNCAPPRYYAVPGDNVYLLADYYDAVRVWSAHDEVHRGLIGLADAYTTYRSWEVRQAYIQLIKNDARPDEEILDRLIEREMNNWRRGHEFYVGLYCYDDDWNRLTGMDPVWRLTLCSDTAEPVHPQYIEKIELPSAEAKIYLNYLTEWRSVYRVIFPLVDEHGNSVISRNTRCFRLSCTSIVGELMMKWRLGAIPEGLK